MVRTPNQRQHKTLTLENKIVKTLLPGVEPASCKYLGSVISDEGSRLQDSTDNSSIDKVETSLE